MAMFTVLQVTPALNAGGVERTTLEVAEAVVLAGGRALVASRGGRLEPELKEVGGELIRLSMDVKSPLAIWGNAGNLAQIIRSKKVTVVHARSRAPAWSALWAARRTKTPFVTTYHGVYNAKSSAKTLYNSVMARGDVVIANSEFTRRHILETHHTNPDRVVTIPRGVDLQAFDPALVSSERKLAQRRTWGIEDNDTRLIILMPTRMTRWKGHEVLIDAAAAAFKDRPHAFLVLMAGSHAGRDAYRNSLQARIDGHGLTADVRVIDHQSDMPAALATADIVVTPSIEPEAFGRVAIEAQAMAKPVIASSLGGFLETIKDGETGHLTPPGDAYALARALLNLTDATADRRAAMGLAGRAWVKGRYSKLALQKATLLVYRRVATERR